MSVPDPKPRSKHEALSITPGNNYLLSGLSRDNFFRRKFCCHEASLLRGLKPVPHPSYYTLWQPILV
jgi:hypothetical protein